MIALLIRRMTSSLNSVQQSQGSSSVRVTLQRNGKTVELSTSQILIDNLRKAFQFKLKATFINIAMHACKPFHAAGGSIRGLAERWVWRVGPFSWQQGKIYSACSEPLYHPISWGTNGKQAEYEGRISVCSVMNHRLTSSCQYSTSPAVPWCTSLCGPFRATHTVLIECNVTHASSLLTRSVLSTRGWIYCVCELGDSPCKTLRVVLVTCCSTCVHVSIRDVCLVYFPITGAAI